MRQRPRPALWLLAATFTAGRAGSQPGETAAPDDTMPRIEISISRRHLWVIGPAGDTMLTAPVAVGSGRTLSHDGRAWRFTTPRGETVVRAKEVDPLWIPPDWHYVELARKLHLQLVRLDRSRPTPLRDGRAVVVRGSVIGLVGPDSGFRELPGDEEVILGGTLYVPPLGTNNRSVRGALGPYRLLLANGVGLHGTPYKESIGHAVTHGCIRLYDEDIIWLYENVPVGARVSIR